jgi:hypothetical protein
LRVHLAQRTARAAAGDESVIEAVSLLEHAQPVSTATGVNSDLGKHVCTSMLYCSRVAIRRVKTVRFDLMTLRGRRSQHKNAVRSSGRWRAAQCLTSSSPTEFHKLAPAARPSSHEVRKVKFTEPRVDPKFAS